MMETAVNAVISVSMLSCVSMMAQDVTALMQVHSIGGNLNFELEEK